MPPKLKDEEHRKEKGCLLSRIGDSEHQGETKKFIDNEVVQEKSKLSITMGRSLPETGQVKAGH